MTKAPTVMPMPKYALVVIVVVLSFVAPVAAGSFEDAVAAHERGDYATALRLLRPLAEQGNAAAQYSLGLMYHLGHGVRQDYAVAGTWYRVAADRGNANAQNNLGVMYVFGHGVPQDYGEALMWFRFAAVQGHTDAQNTLGFMYYKGQGVPQDFVFAHMWFNLSAAQGDQEAVKNRDIVAAKMTAAQIAEAQRLAREWKPTTQPSR